MTDPERRYGRRRVLYLAGIVGASALAGCTDDGASAGDDDGTEDDGASGANGDDGPDTSGEDDDSEGDDGGSDSSGDDDGSTDDGDTGGEEDEDGDGEDGTDDSGEGPRLRDVFAIEQSYVMEFESSDGTGTWTFHEGDSYLEAEFNGETTELYRITTDSGVDTYTVAGGECFKRSVDIAQDDIFDPEQPEADSEEYYASGTATVEGQEAYVFEVEGGTYYVSVETGYPVRFESQEGDVVTFHSWGETDPISPPEGECTEL